MNYFLSLFLVLSLYYKSIWYNWYTQKLSTKLFTIISLGSLFKMYISEKILMIKSKIRISIHVYQDVAEVVPILG